MVSPPARLAERLVLPVRHAARRRLITVVALVVLALSVPVGVSVADAAPSPSAPPTTRLALGAVKEVNYMPATASWQDMWSRWNPAQLTSDYRTIKALGANTVRVTIPAPTMGYPSPYPLMVGRLAQLLALAAAQGLHVQLTLFDNFGLYSQIAASRSFVRLLLARYANDPQIAFVEVQNEIWPGNRAAMAWAAAMLPAVKSVVRDVPVTISTPGSLGVRGLIHLKRDLAATPPDFYDFHFYGSIGAAYSTIAAAKAAAAPSKLFVGEAGINTAGPGGAALLQSQQAEFYNSVNAATAALSLPPAAPWTMFDLTRSGAPAGTRAADLDWGLYRVNHSPKPAAGLERSFFQTGRVSLIDNAAFRASYGGVPTGWLPINRTAGVLTRNPGPRGGSPSVQISDARGSQGAQAAWSTTADLGAITPGQRVAAAVWARGAAATGRTTISIAWFNDRDTFLANATSAPLPTGRTGWTRLHVASSAPIGAAYAVVNLQSYADKGKVKFRNVSFQRV